jgi:hypothetical protein
VQVAGAARTGAYGKLSCQLGFGCGSEGSRFLVPDMDPVNAALLRAARLADGVDDRVEAVPDDSVDPLDASSLELFYELGGKFLGHGCTLPQSDGGLTRANIVRSPQGCRAAIRYTAHSVSADSYGCTMTRTEPLPSPNAIHGAARRERSNIAFDAGLIFGGGAYVYFALVVCLTVIRPPRSGGKSVDIPTSLIRSLEMLEVSDAAMAQFLALGGAVLALNRFDRFSHAELGTERSTHLTVRLNFKTLIQTLLTLITATAPYCAITRLASDFGRPNWEQEAIGTLVLCLVLWLVLLLAGPFGMHFGLEAIQSKWRLADVLFQAGTLEKRWQHRWGMPIIHPKARGNFSLRIVGLWSYISVLMAMLMLGLTFIDGSNREALTASGYGYLALLSAAGFLYIGFFLLVSSCALAMLSTTAADHGRRGLQQVLRCLAYALSPAALIGLAVALQTFYYPLVTVMTVMSAIHIACIRGLFDNQHLVSQPWNPVRRLVLDIRQWSHARAQERWRLLSKSWTSRMTELAPGDYTDELKKAQIWRDRHQLQLPFIPDSRNLRWFNFRKHLSNKKDLKG